MDLSYSPEQQQLVGAFSSLYAKYCTWDVVAASEATGFAADLWVRVLAVGAMEMAVSTDENRAGLVDLALVAEQHGRAIAPTPMIEAQVAGRLLTALGTAGGCAAVAPASSTSLTSIAVRPADRNVAYLVPAGAIADNVVVLDGDVLKLAPARAGAVAVANLGCLPLADVTLSRDAQVLARGRAAVSFFARAVDEWRVLTAAALTGLAARALEIVVEYVKQREAFGKPLGAFQGISHRLADHAAEIDGCRLLVLEAAWATESDPDRAGELAAMALGFAAETARGTTYHAVHFHGGYGFMLEYAIQGYFRRARAWGAVLENPAASYRLVADRRAERCLEEVAG